MRHRRTRCSATSRAGPHTEWCTSTAAVKEWCDDHWYRRWR
jgi:hypothetical protein